MNPEYYRIIEEVDIDVPQFSKPQTRRIVLIIKRIDDLNDFPLYKCIKSTDEDDVGSLFRMSAFENQYCTREQISETKAFLESI